MVDQWAAQACTLTRNATSNLSVCRMMPDWATPIRATMEFFLRHRFDSRLDSILNVYLKKTPAISYTANKCLTSVHWQFTRWETSQHQGMHFKPGLPSSLRSTDHSATPFPLPETLTFLTLINHWTVYKSLFIRYLIWPLWRNCYYPYLIYEETEV